jgi:hypothetical protein
VGLNNDVPDRFGHETELSSNEMAKGTARDHGPVANFAE